MERESTWKRMDDLKLMLWSRPCVQLGIFILITSDPGATEIHSLSLGDKKTYRNGIITSFHRFGGGEQSIWTCVVCTVDTSLHTFRCEWEKGPKPERQHWRWNDLRSPLTPQIIVKCDGLSVWMWRAVLILFRLRIFFFFERLGFAFDFLKKIYYRHFACSSALKFTFILKLDLSSVFLQEFAKVINWRIMIVQYCMNFK